MTQLETRYPCPVCLGATLQKSVVIESPELKIDHCPRCGGVWFDFGEIQHLRRAEPKVLWELVAPHTEVHRMQCHHCSAYLQRTDPACAGCGSKNELQCPKCAAAMDVAYHEGLRLDACARCKGVWFDRHELDAIWRIELSTALKRRSRLQAAGDTAGDTSIVLLDALTWDPWLTFYGVHVAGDVIGGVASGLSNAPEIAAGVGGAVAEAAASVFEAIFSIIGDIFG